MATKRQAFKTHILPGFPCPHRYGRAELFRELLGGVGRSTFARQIVDGTLPTADAKLGPVNLWLETTMARVMKEKRLSRAGT